MIRFLAPLLLSLSVMSCTAAETNQPEEAGKVAWGRDLDAALAASKTDKKPVFALFQEIPELGVFTVQSDSPLDYIFSLYATRAIPWSSGNANDAAINADANNQVVFDFDKWKNMVGVKELTVASRRNPVATYGQDGKPTPGQGLSYGAFISRLNWELFSYNQFNDLFQDP